MAKPDGGGRVAELEEIIATALSVQVDDAQDADEVRRILLMADVPLGGRW